MIARTVMRGALGCCLASLLLVAGATRAPAATLCLPPLFEGGQRLHSLLSPTLFWIEPAMRQHELCWRRADETRIVVLGNSGPFGLPVSAEDSFVGRINADFARRAIPAHLFNLAWVGPYQLRDMVILERALRFEPDVVIYPITLDDFIHVAPYNGAMVSRFMQSNGDVLRGWGAEPPAGLEDPVRIYQHAPAYQGENGSPLDHLRELGRALRRGVRASAYPIGAALADEFSAPPSPRLLPFWTYDCARTLAADSHFAEWQTWNSLAYLDALRRTRLAEVMVVLWPIAHVPDGACYNFRYSETRLAEFRRVITEECARRGLPLIDLLDALPRERFVDSLHIDAEGQRQLAERLGPAIETVVADVRRRAPRPPS